MRKTFWRAVALFAYRRWVTPGTIKPVGIPGNRDPVSPCAGYEPVKRAGYTWDCQGDGHYLCKACCHFEHLEEKS